MRKFLLLLITVFLISMVFTACSGNGQDNQSQPAGRGDFPGGQGGRPPNGFDRGDMPDMETMQQAMQIIQNAGGEITDEVNAELKKLGLTDEQIDMLSNMLSRFPDGMPDGFPDGNRPDGFPNRNR